MSWSPAYSQYPAASSTPTSVPNFESHLKNLNQFHKGLNAELLLTLDEFEKANSTTNDLDNLIEQKLHNHLNQKLNQSVEFPLLVCNAEASKIQSFFIANAILLSSKMEKCFDKMVKIDSMYDSIGKAIRNEFFHEHEPYFDDCFLQAEVFAIKGILQHSKEIGITGYLTEETEEVKDGLCTTIYIQSYLHNFENIIDESMIKLANKANQLEQNKNFPIEDALFEPKKVQKGKHLLNNSTVFSKAGWEDREAVAIMFFQKYVIPHKEQTISTKALMTVVHFAEIIALCAEKVAQLELQSEIPLPPPPPPVVLLEANKQIEDDHGRRDRKRGRSSSISLVQNSEGSKKRQKENYLSLRGLR
ncbi:hypothetical protein BC937DRAFT_92492 [Endogone sp. FLAS-F59071]|nr:hypothetical protein BC937DRAFT_92492 [Endogone sp. FLAS-F59071]|eukprot:RUS15417.1 hypothetical protein BC937DRAFT_92492 [Endogone sp. FLAS-F59071]